MRHFDYRLASVTSLGFTVVRFQAFKLRPLPVFVALSMGIHAASVNAAPPLPQNGQFVGGAGTIKSNGANLDITQSSSRGIIDWNSFAIGAGRTVSINNGSGATLNRVTGKTISTINGNLKSTGSVYLINPQGVVVGASGVITTGGRFVASSLDVDNDTFMQDFGFLTFSGPSTSAVINLGKISSTGGDVFLVGGKDVVNAGTISAPNGTAELASGSQVLLVDYSGGRQLTVQLGSGGKVLNAGTVRAAQIGLQTVDGNVYALAGKNSALRATGTDTRDGHVWLVANGGTADVRGAAIAATNAGGNGGTVEMTGSTLKVDGAKVSAAEWDLTAPAFTIDRATANTLASNLSSGTSVAVNATGANGATGDIGVQSDIRWKGASSLALNAYHSVALAQRTTLANTGTGNLTLRADANALDNGGSVTNNGAIDWCASTGIVSALYDMNGTYKPGTIRSNTKWSAAPFSGLVTQVTGYQLVNTVADLNAVNKNLGGAYALGTTIDLGGTLNNVPAIGSAAHPFTGQFDGMGHLLSSLNTDTGLFSVIGKTGVVRNFDLVGSTATSSSGPVGLLAAENDGRVVLVGTTGRVVMTADPGTSIGGLVGVNRGSIERSWSGAATSGQGEMGGLVGENDGSIVQSYSLGYLSGGTHSQVGGLAGVNRGTIAQSYSSNTVNGANVLGGLAGTNSGAISQSFTKATLVPAGTTAKDPGAIAGTNTGTIAADVYWNADTSGALAGVGSGKAAPVSSRMTTVQMASPANYGPSWDFTAKGAWAFPSDASVPVLRWLNGS